MKIKKTVVISDEVWNEVKDVSENFSSVVESALRLYLRQRKVAKAKRAFGSWKRGKESLEIVKEIRKDDRRRKALNID